MNTIDRQAIKDLIEDEQTTNMSIVTYLSAVAMSKLDNETGYPTIYNFTVYKLYKNMKDKMDWINESSISLAFERLISQGFLAYLDEEKNILAILNSGSGHIPNDENYKSDGYIYLHHFFFNRIFYKLTLPAKKLALYFASRLDGDAAREPYPINFKSKKDPESFPKWCKTLKVNRLAHIKSIIKELKGLFNIIELKHNTIKITLNTISKACITGTDKLWNFTQDQVKKTEKILKEVNTKNFKFRYKDILEITEAIKENTMEFNRKVLKELCKNSRKDVIRMIGYVGGISSRLKSNPI